MDIACGTRRWGATPLDEAERSENQEIASILRKYMDMNESNPASLDDKVLDITTGVTALGSMNVR